MKLTANLRSTLRFHGILTKFFAFGLFRLRTLYFEDTILLVNNLQMQKVTKKGLSCQVHLLRRRNTNQQDSQQRPHYHGGGVELLEKHSVEI